MTPRLHVKNANFWTPAQVCEAQQLAWRLPAQFQNSGTKKAQLHVRKCLFVGSLCAEVDTGSFASFARQKKAQLHVFA